MPCSFWNLGRDTRRKSSKDLMRRYSPIALFVLPACFILLAFAKAAGLLPDVPGSKVLDSKTVVSYPVRFNTNSGPSGLDEIATTYEEMVVTTFDDPKWFITGKPQRRSITNLFLIGTVNTQMEKPPVEINPAMIVPKRIR